MNIRALPMLSVAFAAFAFVLPAANAAPRESAKSKSEGSQPLEVFGVALKNAARDDLRQAFKQNGLRATREDASFWVDTYDAKGVLEGATGFQAGYVAASGRFAYAQYTFSSFMDARQVGNVITLVSNKYGRPSSQRGNASLGPVTATWNKGQGMQIEVSRGWPDTTTYLTFRDTAAYARMRAEIEAEQGTQQRQKAKAQSRAF